jgi:hypothetical protein
MADYVEWYQMSVSSEAEMTLVICPGMHDPALSDRFCQALFSRLSKAAPTAADHSAQPYLLMPTDRHAPFDGWGMWSYWQTQIDPSADVLIIAFSAGVVGAIAAAQLWQGQGRTVTAVIAIDGWGVPHLGNFPCHRLSHDHFTHWSSALLGAGLDSFYAEPGVEHLAMWRSPDQVSGYWLPTPQATPHQAQKTTAVEFIASLLQRYGYAG